jgi:acyl carrier protein
MDKTFEDLVRRHAELPDDRPVSADERLEDLGLRSLASVQLLVDLEDTYGVEFPDDLLTPETFETPGTLWAALQIVLNRHAPSGSS